MLSMLCCDTSMSLADRELFDGHPISIDLAGSETKEEGQQDPVIMFDLA